MALERRDHRVDIGPAGRNIFISRDKQLQSRQAKRIKVLMRLVMVLVGLVVAVGVGLFVALYMVPYFQAEISLDSSSSAQGGGLSSLSQVEMPTYDSMGLPVYDDEVALFVINQNNPQDASYVPNTVEAEGVQVEAHIASALQMLVEAKYNIFISGGTGWRCPWPGRAICSLACACGWRPTRRLSATPVPAPGCGTTWANTALCSATPRTRRTTPAAPRI